MPSDGAAKPAAAAAPGSTGRQTAHHRFGAHDTPKLVNSLNVAKSPLEPVTLALTVNESPADPQDSLQKSRDQQDESTTRAIQEERETFSATVTAQPVDVSTTEPTTSSNVSDPSESTESTSQAEPEVKDIESTTVKQNPETTTLASDRTISSTTTTAAPETTTTIEPMTESVKIPETKLETTASPPVEVSTSTGDNKSDPATSEASQNDHSSDLPNTTSTAEAQTTMPSSSSPERSEVTLPPEDPTQDTTAKSTPASDVSSLPTELSTPSSVDSSGSTTAKVDPEPETTPVVAEAPVPVSTTASPTTAPPNSSTTTPGEDTKAQPCSYLPTYDPEEMQRVFREETTYRNGTIKGKFTYINFDQRYRLVHYTRLPYGPVKIDQVEELGRPEAPANQSTTISPNEVPNAVLQLRNILPNSLFGFPFVGPQQSQSRTPSDADRSYFYSTSSISAPNSPSSNNVPISAFINQRNQHVADTLASSYHFDTLSTLEGRYASPGNKISPMPKENHEQPKSIHRFQYAVPLASNSPIEHPRHTIPIMYNYVNPAPLRYQYSPVPVFTLGQSIVREQPKPALLYSQPEFISDHKQLEQHEPVDMDLFNRETHQSHSRDHYMAPFMMAQHPSQPRMDQRQALGTPVEQPKLKIKISKTSRSLQAQHRLDNQSGVKSAQLRDSPSSMTGSGHIATSHRQQRQRAGKQNQNLRSYPVNSSPIVFHVSKNPLSRTQSAPLTPIYNY